MTVNRFRLWTIAFSQMWQNWLKILSNEIFSFKIELKPKIIIGKHCVIQRIIENDWILFNKNQESYKSRKRNHFNITKKSSKLKSKWYLNAIERDGEKNERKKNTSISRTFDLQMQKKELNIMNWKLH